MRCPFSVDNTVVFENIESIILISSCKRIISQCILDLFIIFLKCSKSLFYQSIKPSPSSSSLHTHTYLSRSASLKGAKYGSITDNPVPSFGIFKTWPGETSCSNVLTSKLIFFCIEKRKKEEKKKVLACMLYHFFFCNDVLPSKPVFALNSVLYLCMTWSRCGLFFFFFCHVKFRRYLWKVSTDNSDNCFKDCFKSCY